MNASTSQPDSQADQEVVTEPARIASFLDDIKRHLLLVSVRLDAEGPLYESLLLELDRQRGLLYLDDLKPDENPPELAPDQTIDVFVTLKGTAIRFSSRIAEVLLDAGQGERRYRAHYPTEVLYLKRRDILRVRLPLYDRRYVTLRQGERATEIRARLIDLSVSGFCLEIDEDLMHPDQAGTRFEYSGMRLPGLRNSLSGEAELINLRASPTAGFLSAGFAILDLDPQTERSLMRAALHYQREARRMGI